MSKRSADRTALAPKAAAPADPALQRKANGPGGHASVPPIAHGVPQSSGAALDAATRAELEPRFGHDFSNVRVHTDAAAAQSAQAAAALAYTIGRDIVFANGRYAPSTPSGKSLLAHELTHVVQQQDAGPSHIQRQAAAGGTTGSESGEDVRAAAANPVGEISNAGLEAEADSVSARVAAGQSAAGTIRGRVRNARPQFQHVVTAAPQGGGEKKAEKDPVKEEWDAHPKVHGYFNNGFADYQELRPLYMSNTATTNPAQWIEDNITTATFFGHSTPAHSELRTMVAAAETSLKAAGVEPEIKDFWSFNPRKIRGSSRLSKHALGKAFDINNATNPRITDQAVLATLTLITGLDFKSGSLTPADLKAKSDDFKATFNEAKFKELLDGKEAEKSEAAAKLKEKTTGKDEKHQLNKSIAAVTKTIANIKSSKKTLLTLAKTGFLNLDTQLVQAFIDAGLTWGGQFQRSKDFMHFEVP